MQSFYLARSLAFNGSAAPSFFAQQGSTLQYRGCPYAEPAAVNVQANGLTGCYRGQRTQFSSPVVRSMQSDTKSLTYRGASY